MPLNASIAGRFTKIPEVVGVMSTSVTIILGQRVVPVVPSTNMRRDISNKDASSNIEPAL